MFFLIAICYLFSNNRKAINWKVVGIGIVAMIAF
ncbi:MAG: Na+ dependent nucleoside transporter N-terminal domain-containing protein, partial [Sphingobacteriales bacterium]